MMVKKTRKVPIITYDDKKPRKALMVTYQVKNPRKAPMVTYDTKKAKEGTKGKKIMVLNQQGTNGNI